MNKKILFITAIILITLQSFAQVTLFQDDFNVDVPNSGNTHQFHTYTNWDSHTEDADGRHFEIFDVEAFKAGPVANPNQRQGFPMSGYAIDSDSWESNLIFFPNNYITTKQPIDLTNVTAPVNVSFLIGSYAAGGTGNLYLGDRYSVYLTIDSTPSIIENETPIYTGLISDLVTAHLADASASAVLQTINVDSFIGNSYYLSFRHHDSSNQNSVLIDNVKVEANSTASLNDLQKIGFSYFPNPVNNVLNLNANKNITEIKIINTLGQEIISVSNMAIQHQINTQNLDKGVYLVKIKATDLSGTFKFIKQ